MLTHCNANAKIPNFRSSNARPLAKCQPWRPPSLDPFRRHCPYKPDNRPLYACDDEGVTYRFRVVAIYSNNDNRHGPSSKRVTLGSATDRWSKVLVPGPVIVEARPLSSSEIFIGWQVCSP